jgi:hypothetical protein
MKMSPSEIVYRAEPLFGAETLPGGPSIWQKDSTLLPVNADRWKQVEDCYHAAMEQPVPERAAFLPQACANDPELRGEVQSPLDQQADSFHRHAQKAKNVAP